MGAEGKVLQMKKGGWNSAPFIYGAYHTNCVKDLALRTPRPKWGQLQIWMYRKTTFYQLNFVSPDRTGRTPKGRRQEQSGSDCEREVHLSVWNHFHTWIGHLSRPSENLKDVMEERTFSACGLTLPWWAQKLVQNERSHNTLLFSGFQPHDINQFHI